MAGLSPALAGPRRCSTCPPDRMGFPGRPISAISLQCPAEPNFLHGIMEWKFSFSANAGHCGFGLAAFWRTPLRVHVKAH